MAFEIREQGHSGDLVSLGGLVDNSSRGRVNTGDSQTITTAVQIMPANSRRISALINNNGPDDLYIFGLAISGATAWAVIRSGGSFQIDRDYPWTGEVTVQAVSGSCGVFWSEISLP